MALTPYGAPLVEDDDIQAVVDVLKSGWLTTGPMVDEFEHALFKHCAAQEAVACNSGTAALHLAYQALGIGEGDIVIVPAQTFAATANAARFLGAEIQFCDVDPETGLMTKETLEKAISCCSDTRRIRAITIVHLNGQQADMQTLSKICHQNGWAIVEDACHALGGFYENGSPVGSCSHSDMTVFSFHAVKTITAGEGGAITTNDAQLATRMRTMRSHGITRNPADFEDSSQALSPEGEINPWYYEMQDLGWNYRLSDIGCALALSQLKKLPRFAETRATLRQRYEDRLQSLAPVCTPVPNLGIGTPAWHLLAVKIDFDGLGKSRASVMTSLREKGIGTQVHYIPLHRQPYYKKRYGAIGLPGADTYYKQVLSLPLHVGMRVEDVDRICEALKAILLGP